MRKQKPLPQDSKPMGQMPKELGGGPKAIEVDKPDTKSILKKLQSIPRDSAKKYIQRSGQ
jgi:hypothetical protein